MSAVRSTAGGPHHGAVLVLNTARRAAAELLLVGALFLLYKLGRTLAAGHERVANANAHVVHGLEQALHLPSGATIQAMIGSTHLYELANTCDVAVGPRSERTAVGGHGVPIASRTLLGRWPAEHTDAMAAFASSGRGRSVPTSARPVVHAPR